MKLFGKLLQSLQWCVSGEASEALASGPLVVLRM